MILVCPSCDAKFNVPDGALGAAGRKVRCARCKHSWHATSAHALKVPAASPASSVAAPMVAAPVMAPAHHVMPAVANTAELDAGAAARAAALRQSMQADNPVADAHASSEDDDLFDEGIKAAPLPEVQTEADVYSEDPLEKFMRSNRAASEGEDFDSDFPDEDDEDSEEDDFEDIGLRRRQSERKRLAWKRRIILLGWIALLLFVLGIFGVLVLNKDGVTHAFPGTHQLYDFFAHAGDSVDDYRPAEGEPVSTPLGEIDVYVRADLYGNLTRIEEKDGLSQLAVRGLVENTGPRAAYVPKLQLLIKDGAGRVIDQWVHEPVGQILSRKAKLQFETFRYPVPAGMASVEVKALEGTRSTQEATAG